MITQISRVLSSSSKSRIQPRALQRWPNSVIRQQSASDQPLHRQHIRHYSAPTPPPAPEFPKPIDLRSQFPSTAAAQAPIPPAKTRSIRSYIYATLFLALGLTAGQYMRLIVTPPPLPLADSKEDNLMVEFITKEAEKLPLVRSLSVDPSWKSYDAYANLKPENRAHTLSTGPLGGARATGGFRRTFYNDSGEFVTVIWFGGAVAGWPGVCHGGLLATILDETLGRCAIQQFPVKTGVTANLELNYLKPAITNSFYVIRAIPQTEGSTELKQWVTGTLETIDGRVCVKARGLFVLPKKFKTQLLA